MCYSSILLFQWTKLKLILLPELLLPYARILEFISQQDYGSAHTKHASYSIHVSQGSVATRFGCGGILNDSFIANFPTQSTCERILKIRWELGHSVDMRKMALKEKLIQSYL